MAKASRTQARILKTLEGLVKEVQELKAAMGDVKPQQPKPKPGVKSQTRKG